MRTLNSIAAFEAAKALGTEPLTIVGVQWTLDGPTTWYADKDLPALNGKILGVSGIDSIIKLKRGGSSGSVSVDLDDTDGSIKTVFDANDIHKARAKVYQSYHFSGSDAFTNKFLALSGRVETPISWSEGERKLSIEIVSNIEDAEIGFSPEEGAFPQMADSAVGKAWPLCCGSPIRVPAVKVIEQIRGSSLTLYGLVSRTEADELCTKAIALNTAERAKAAYVQNQKDRLAVVDDDEDPLDDETYEAGLAGLINAVTVAYVALLNFQERLIAASPNQEDNVNDYAQLCLDVADAQARLLAAQIEEEELANELNALILARNQARENFDVQKLRFQQNPANVDVVADLNAAIAALNQAIATQNAKEAEIEEFGDTVAQIQTEVTALLAQQTALKGDLLAWTLESMEVDGGEKFPQNETIQVIVNGVRLEGIFSNRTFTISDATLATYRDLGFADRQKVTPNLFWLDELEAIKGHYCLLRVNDGFSPNHRVVFINSQKGARCAYNPVVWQLDDGTIVKDENGDPVLDDDGQPETIVEDFDFYRPAPGNGNILETSPIFLPRWDQFFTGSPHITGLDNLPDNDWQLNIGDTVYLAEDFQEKYVANLIPSSSISEVLAERTVDGITRLQPIPSNYYTISLAESLAGQNPTTVTFRRPLKDYPNEGWSDNIFVSLTSSEGPNTASFIRYLIDTYSPILSPDPATFGSLTTILQPYPSHFAILTRKNLLSTIEDMAWQARSLVFARNDVVFMKYVAQRNNPVDTLHENDLDVKSMTIDFFESEELVTRLIAKWRPDYHSEELEVIQRNNIPKYGDIEKEFKFWIYNIRSLVEKSAQFWLIRYSNTWKRLKFTTPLHKIALESIDTISLAFSNPWVANGTVRGEIESAQLDTGAYKVVFDVWVPVRAGEMSEYSFAYPASAASDLFYPTPLDLFAGGGSDGTPPQADAVFDDDKRPPDLGPKKPGDSGDVAPINPVEGRNEIDYLIHDQRDSDDEDPGLTEIDIRTTAVIDSVKGTRTLMDTMVSIGVDPADGDTKLALNSGALMAGIDEGEEALAALEHKLDTVDTKFRPSAAFLKE